MKQLTRVCHVSALLVLSACSSTPTPGGGGDGGGGSTDPCDLATAGMVATAFGGTSSDGVAGQIRNCVYTLTGGASATVNVYYYGAADDWDGIRNGFEENRGGTTDLPDIGEAAYHPNDVGPLELVVRAGDVVFSVSGGIFAEASVAENVEALARAIADGL